MSPTFTASFSPFSPILAVLDDFITAVFTSLDDVFPLVKALFKIVPVASSFTLTVNLVSTLSPALISMYHFIPTTTSFSLMIFAKSPALPSTYVVFSGIISATSTFFTSSSVLFFILSVYSISSPCVTKFEPVFVLAIFLIDISDFSLSILADTGCIFNSIGFHATFLSSVTLTKSPSVTLVIVEPCIESISLVSLLLELV